MSSYMKTFMETLRQMKTNEIMTDVRLILPDKTIIACHKLVLSAASPFFQTMFSSGMKETSEVLVKFADPDIIRMIVEYFYSGEIEIDDGNVQDLVAASDFLDLKALKVQYEEFMSSITDASNCIKINRFAKKFDLSQ